MPDQEVIQEAAVLEAPATVGSADVKTAALAMPDKIDVEGFTCHAFSAMRKGFVEMTHNEIVNAEKHCREYITDNNLPEDDLKNPEKSWAIMEKAIPNFMFQLTALAYICTQSAKTLSALIGKPQDAFAEAVLNCVVNNSTEDQ